MTGALDNPVYYSTRKPSPQPGSQRKSSPQPVPPPAASSKAADGGFGSAEEAERHQAACRIQRAQRCNAARGSRRAKEAQRDREMWDQVWLLLLLCTREGAGSAGKGMHAVVCEGVHACSRVYRTGVCRMNTG